METITLKPAETYVLIHKGNIRLSIAIKLILADLILEHALLIERDSDNKQLLVRGKKYQEYSQKGEKFEKLILMACPAEGIEFISFMKLVRNPLSNNKMASIIAKSPRLAPYIKSSLFVKFKMKDEAYIKLKELKAILKEAEEILSSDETTNEEKLSCLQKIGHNYILIPGFELESIKQIITVHHKRKKTRQTPEFDDDDEYFIETIDEVSLEEMVGENSFWGKSSIIEVPSNLDSGSNYFSNSTYSSTDSSSHDDYSSSSSSSSDDDAGSSSSSD